MGANELLAVQVFGALAIACTLFVVFMTRGGKATTVRDILGDPADGPPPPQRVALVAADMSWGETFYLLLKLGLCAIPAIWIAWFAWHLPGAIFQASIAAKVGAEVREMADQAKADRERALQQKNPLD